MKGTGWPSSSRPVTPLLAVGMAFVLGLIGTAVVGVWLRSGPEDTATLQYAGVGAVGAVCALTGAATRSRFAALAAGSVGLAVAVVVGDPGWQAPWLVWLWVILGIPYLIGFLLALLLVEAFVGGLRRVPRPGPWASHDPMRQRPR